MDEFIVESETTLRVRYGETDQMGYCYYGNYAQYFEVGRVEAMRQLGASYKQLEEQGVMLPVMDFSVKYLAPAFYDDLLKISTKIVSLRGARLKFSYEIFNEQGKKLSIGETTLVFIKKESKMPTAPPEEFVQLLNKLSDE